MGDKYNKKALVVMFVAIIILLFIVGYTRNITPELSDIVKGLAISLLASSIFFFAFLHFNISSNENEKNVNSIFNKSGTNSKMGEQYWIELISEMHSTEKDIYFYGSSLKLWLERNIYKEALLSELKKKKKKKNIVYFIIHEKNYVRRWEQFFMENQISFTSSNTNINNEKNLVEIIHIEGNNCYSIVCCGSKISVTLRTNIGRSEDSPTFEVLTKSDIGKLFLDYLICIVKNRNIPNRL